MSDFHQQTPHKHVGAAPWTFGAISCVVGAAGNVLAIVEASALRHVPPGSSIRPMWSALMLCLIAIGTGAAGVPLGIIGIIRGRQRIAFWSIAALGILLSLMPMPTAHCIWDWIVARNGLIMEQ